MSLLDQIPALYSRQDLMSSTGGLKEIKKLVIVGSSYIASQVAIRFALMGVTDITLAESISCKEKVKDDSDLVDTLHSRKQLVRPIESVIDYIMVRRDASVHLPVALDEIVDISARESFHNNKLREIEEEDVAGIYERLLSESATVIGVFGLDEVMDLLDSAHEDGCLVIECLDDCHSDNLTHEALANIDISVSFTEEFGLRLKMAPYIDGHRPGGYHPRPQNEFDPSALIGLLCNFIVLNYDGTKAFEPKVFEVSNKDLQDEFYSNTKLISYDEVVETGLVFDLNEFDTE